MKELRTWFDKEVYNKEIEVFFKDCDSNRKMKLSAIMGYASDIAGNDYTDRGITRKEMKSINQVFLLARYHFSFYRVPSEGEKITYKTWEKGVESGYVLRDFEILDSNNKVCVLISSTWIVVDTNTRKIIRPKNFKLREINTSDRVLDCEPCGKINFDNEKLNSLGEREVFYTDIDANGHMNNANYGSFAADFLPYNLRDRTLSDFYINYNKEAMLGDRISLFGYLEANDYYMIGRIDNTISFTCKFVLKDI
jgi:acyl-ACP thioesterase